MCKKDSKERGKQSSGRTRSLGRTSCQEESNPSRNYDSCPKGGCSGLHPRHCKETGTLIMGLTPWQLTKPKPAGILHVQQGKEETGKQEIPATPDSWRSCSWRKSAAA